jgi:hypothetical protein
VKWWKASVSPQTFGEYNKIPRIISIIPYTPGATADVFKYKTDLLYDTSLTFKAMFTLIKFRLYADQERERYPEGHPFKNPPDTRRLSAYAKRFTLPVVLSRSYDQCMLLACSAQSRRRASEFQGSRTEIYASGEEEQYAHCGAIYLPGLV